MAIDDKFISANLSKDVVAQLNRPRRRKRRGPRPWDKKSSTPESPTPEVQDLKEVIDENSTSEQSERTNDVQSAHNSSKVELKSIPEEKSGTSSELHRSPETGEDKSEGKDLPVSPTSRSEAFEELAHNERTTRVQSAHNSNSRLGTNERTDDVQSAHSKALHNDNERTNSAQNSVSEVEDEQLDDATIGDSKEHEEAQPKPNQRTISARSSKPDDIEPAHNQRTISAHGEFQGIVGGGDKRTISAQRPEVFDASQKDNQHTKDAQSAYNQRTYDAQSAHNKSTDRVHSTLNQSTVERTDKRTISAQIELRSDYYVLSGQELKFLQLVLITEI